MNSLERIKIHYERQETDDQYQALQARIRSQRAKRKIAK